MDSGLYAAYTGLLARTQALDTAASNLANAATNGFRAQRDTFRGVLASGLERGIQGSQVGESVNGFGVLGASALDFGQGPIVPTANPLDLALNGTGFFAIQTIRGIRYTRDGSFSRSVEGQIQTQAGEPLLDASMKAIVLPSGPVEVSSNATISVGGGEVGRIGIFYLPSGSLVAEGSNRYVSSVQPASGAATVQQGAVEGANQDAVHGTMQLILIQRQAEMMQKALSVFHNEFDKTSVDEISKL